jgi:hypothetical protein
LVQAFLKKWWVSESDCRKENTNPTQNQPNELGPKILGDMIQSRKAFDLIPSMLHIINLRVFFVGFSLACVSGGFPIEKGD